MKQLTTTFFVLSIFMASCSQGEDRNEPGGGQSGKPYTVSGIIKNGAGNPVKSAKIRIENPNGNNIHYTTTSDEAGKYSVTVSAIGGYKMYAWKEVTTENDTYMLRMGMENDTDYDAFSVPASGTIKNFVWKLSGRIPDRTVSSQNGLGYFGGTIKFINYNSITDEMPPGTEVTIKLTPVAGAKFLDGTFAAGKTVEKKFTILGGVGQAYYINDIPATTYTITASSIKNGVTKTVHIGTGNPDVFTPSAEYYFRSEGSSSSKESGLISPNEHYFYIMNN